MKKSVILYHDYLDTIFSELTDDEVGKLIRALLVFDSTGKLMEFTDRTVKTAYKRMIQDCENNRQKYERICERNRANGAKGGAPKGNKNAKTTQNNPMGYKTTQNNPNNPKQPDNDNDNDNVNENNNGNGKDIPLYKGADGNFYTQQEADNNIMRLMALQKLRES